MVHLAGVTSLFGNSPMLRDEFSRAYTCHSTADAAIVHCENEILRRQDIDEDKVNRFITAGHLWHLLPKSYIKVMLLIHFPDIMPTCVLDKWPKLAIDISLITCSNCASGAVVIEALFSKYDT